MPPKRTLICDTCGQKFKSRGLAAHQKPAGGTLYGCRKIARDRMLEQSWINHNGQARHKALMQVLLLVNLLLTTRSMYILMNLKIGLSYDLPPALQQDNIRTEYHPCSGIPMKTDHFANFCCHTAAPLLVCENTTPWEPFTSRIDFDFTELVLKANLTKLQTNEPISLIHRSALERFSVIDYDGICKLWDAASSCHAKFKKEVILVPHRDQEHDFDVWYRPLWDWACDLLKDPRLGPHFVFDAQRLYKFDGRDFVHFFDKPWTANTFWNSQSSLPKDKGKPFTFIIYADKAKLSSFGRQKAYPVIVRCANLPVGIRNGEGFGGGRLVKEDRQYSGTQSFVNFKNVVWHKSFKCLLKSLAPLSKTADYEEHFLMAISQMCHVIDMWNKVQIPLSQDKEKVLMSQGLWDVDNTFSDVAHTDVHSAVSFDRLHFQECIKSISRQTQSQIDVHFDSIPHWCNINHFNHVMDISFSHGSKNEDISKLIVFATHDIIDQATHTLPYLLLRCIREYVNIDMYATLEVHTLETIAAGRQAIKEFTQLLD
ncbi:hypothetical protein DFJ58DRAFT_850692, partial [Suillus subalutaceus]|uniref:uncharacterized protein n=1 Tax=Suillus subalutaceus TaxID=48586 RepID=UPI001B88042F